MVESTQPKKENTAKEHLDPLDGQVLKAKENLHNVLKEAKGENQVNNLYDHIVEVLNKLVSSCPDKALDRFEEVSYLIKNKDTLALEEFVKVHESRKHCCADEETSKGTAEHIGKVRALFEGAQPGAEDDGAEAQGPAPIGFLPDLVSLNKNVYRWAGIDFGEYQTLILQKTLKKLIVENNATNMRLWGKILGTEQDYYIVEGTAEDPAANPEPPADFEARGTGINTYAYWVANSPMGPWSALEDLVCSDLEAARTIKVHFTGNLDREILTNPFYFRKERHFLRAQIARITMATTLVPARIYRFQEESTVEIEENVPEEGPVPVPSSEEMETKTNWLHYTRNILKCNRITHMDPVIPEGEEVDPDELTKQMIAADPFEARLKPITDDKGCKGNYPAWIVRAYGDKTNYAAANPAVLQDQNYRVVFVKSTVWPGAQSYFTQGTWGQIYIGNGLKHEDKFFYPINPPMICSDPVDRKTYAEPNPPQAVVDAINAKKAAEQKEQENDGQAE